MLSENLKNLRKSKGLSQEELAIKLNVVRQTISKWEQGLSVPDSEMLLKIAEVLDTSVNVLLGESVVSEDDSELKAIAAKLEVLNEQFAKRNEKSRKVWRTIFIIMGILALVSFLQTVISFIYLQTLTNDIGSSTAIIGGAAGPTSILVSRVSVKYGSIITAVLVGAFSIIGICKTKRE